MAAIGLFVVGGSLLLLYAGFTGAGLVASFQAALSGNPLPTSGSGGSGGQGSPALPNPGVGPGQSGPAGQGNQSNPGGPPVAA